ncbi:hypothetical protein [Nocardia cyriacigeorgica]|uniref:hypothetical protein n=1 Tax=Nocardia cyriacigeorgica TaxID=135487 RepID=UPI001E621B68|nr:hypothetical protein [Nocardia cyriacigeorgica]MBF6476739.1 hypothetical protein [Nocardia cyriacigeorgica]
MKLTHFATWLAIFQLRRTIGDEKRRKTVEYVGSVAGILQMIIGTILANTGSGGSGSGW